MQPDVTIPLVIHYHTTRTQCNIAFPLQTCAREYSNHAKEFYQQIADKEIKRC